MASMVSVHIADVGSATGLRLVLNRPRSAGIPGLRHAEIGTAAPLSSKVRPRPTVGRAVLVAIWEDDESIDRFMADHKLADSFASGWHARLQPMRVSGSWPGLEPADTNAARFDGPAVVLTLGRLRLTQARRFLQASAQAQASVLEAPGLIWGTGFARLPFVATCSVWSSTQALTDYAYGGERAGQDGHHAAHPGAIQQDAAKPFHRRSAFVRLRPYRVQGGLSGRNSLDPRSLVARSDGGASGER